MEVDDFATEAEVVEVEAEAVEVESEEPEAAEPEVIELSKFRRFLSEMPMPAVRALIAMHAEVSSVPRMGQGNRSEWDGSDRWTAARGTREDGTVVIRIFREVGLARTMAAQEELARIQSRYLSETRLADGMAQRASASTSEAHRARHHAESRAHRERAKALALRFAETEVAAEPVTETYEFDARECL